MAPARGSSSLAICAPFVLQGGMSKLSKKEKKAIKRARPRNPMQRWSRERLDSYCSQYPVLYAIRTMYG